MGSGEGTFIFFIVFFRFQTQITGNHLVIEEETHHLKKRSLDCFEYHNRCESKYSCKLRLGTAQLRCNYPELDDRGEIIAQDVCTPTCLQELEKFLETPYSKELLLHSIIKQEGCIEVSSRLESCFATHVRRNPFGRMNNGKNPHFGRELKKCEQKILPLYRFCAEAVIELDDEKLCSRKCNLAIGKIQHRIGKGGLHPAVMEYCLYGGDYKESLKRSYQNSEAPSVHLTELEERYQTRCSNPSRIKGQGYGYDYERLSALKTNMPYHDEHETHRVLKEVMREETDIQLPNRSDTIMISFFCLLVSKIIFHFLK